MHNEVRLKSTLVSKKSLLDFIGTTLHYATKLKSYLRVSGDLYYETYVEHNNVMTMLIELEDLVINSKNKEFIITTDHKWFKIIDSAIDKLTNMQDKLETYYKEKTL